MANAVPDFIGLIDQDSEMNQSSTPDFIGMMEQSQPVKPKSWEEEVVDTGIDIVKKVPRLASQYLKSAAIYGTPVGQGLEAAGQLGALAGSETQQTINWMKTAADAIEQLETEKYYNPGQWTEEKQQQLDQFYQIGRMSPEEIKAAGGIKQMPSLAPSAVSSEAEKAIGIDLTPKGLLEKFVSLSGTLRGTAGETSKSIAAKAVDNLNLPTIAKNEAINVLSSAPVSATAAFLEEEGIPEGVTLLATGAAAGLLKAGKYAASQLGKRFFLFDPTNLKLSNLKESFKAEAANQKKYALEQVEKGLMTPKQYEKVSPYLNIAIENNIPVPASAISDSRYFKNIEKIIAKNDLTSAQAIETRRKAAEAWADATENVLSKQARKSHFSSPEAVVEALQPEVVVKKQQDLQKRASDLYKKVSTNVERNKKIDVKYVDRIEKSLNKVYDEVSGSLLPTDVEKGAKGAIQEVRSKLIKSPSEVGRFEVEGVKVPTGQPLFEIEKKQAAESLQRTPGKIGKMRAEAKSQQAIKRKQEAQKKGQQVLEDVFGEESKNMTIVDGQIKFKNPPTEREVIKTVQSLNKKIDWDNPKISNLLVGFQNELKGILGETLGKRSPEIYQDLLKANELYAQNAKLFGKSSRWKKWDIKADTDTDKLLKQLKTPEQIRKFERDFGETPRGKELIKELKYQKTKEILQDVFDRGDYSAGEIANKFHKLKKDKTFRTLIDPKAFKNFEDLSELDKKIEAANSLIYKKNLPEADKTFFFWSLGKLAQYTGMKFIKDVSQGRRAEAFAEIFLDPSFTKNAKRIGEKILAESKKQKPDVGLVRSLISDLAIQEQKLLMQSTGERLKRTSLKEKDSE